MITGMGTTKGGPTVVTPPPLTVGEPHRLQTEQASLTVSVIICAYTEDRWPLLLQSVASVQQQCRIPMEIIVCVDHNDSPQKSTVSVSQLLRGERWVHHHQGRSPRR